MRSTQKKTSMAIPSLVAFIFFMACGGGTTAPSNTFPEEEWPTSTPEAQVMRMKTLSDYDFSATVGDIPEGIALEDFGPSAYAKALEKFGTDVRVTSNKEVKLQGGTRAYRTNIKWMANDFWPITTLLVSAYKDGKVVCVSAHPWHSPYNAVPIVQSLTFK